MKVNNDSQTLETYKKWLKEKDKRIKNLEFNLKLLLFDKHNLQERIKTLSKNEKIIIHFIRERNKEINTYRKMWKKEVKRRYKAENWSIKDKLYIKKTYIRYEKLFHKISEGKGLERYYEKYHNKMYRDVKGLEPIKFNSGLLK